MLKYKKKKTKIKKFVNKNKLNIKIKKIRSIQKSINLFWKKTTKANKKFVSKKKKKEYKQLQLKRVNQRMFIKNHFKRYTQLWKKKRWQTVKKAPFFLRKKYKKTRSKKIKNFPIVRKRFPLKWSNPYARVSYFDLKFVNEAIQDIRGIQNLPWGSGSKKGFRDWYHSWKMYYYYLENHIGFYIKARRGSAVALYPKPYIPPRYLYYISYKWTPYYFAIFRIIELWKKKNVYKELKCILLNKIVTNNEYITHFSRNIFVNNNKKKIINKNLLFLKKKTLFHFNNNINKKRLLVYSKIGKNARSRSKWWFRKWLKAFNKKENMFLKLKIKVIRLFSNSKKNLYKTTQLEKKNLKNKLCFLDNTPMHNKVFEKRIKILFKNFNLKNNEIFFIKKNDTKTFAANNKFFLKQQILVKTWYFRKKKKKFLNGIETFKFFIDMKKKKTLQLSKKRKNEKLNFFDFRKKLKYFLIIKNKKKQKRLKFFLAKEKKEKKKKYYLFLRKKRRYKKLQAVKKIHFGKKNYWKNQQHRSWTLNNWHKEMLRHFWRPQKLWRKKKKFRVLKSFFIKPRQFLKKKKKYSQFKKKKIWFQLITQIKNTQKLVKHKKLTSVAFRQVFQKINKIYYIKIKNKKHKFFIYRALLLKHKYLKKQFKKNKYKLKKYKKHSQFCFFYKKKQNLLATKFKKIYVAKKTKFNKKKQNLIKKNKSFKNKIKYYPVSPKFKKWHRKKKSILKLKPWFNKKLKKLLTAKRIKQKGRIVYYKKYFAKFINKKNYNFKKLLHSNQLKKINFSNLRKSHRLGSFSLQKKIYFVQLTKWFKWFGKKILPTIRRWKQHYIVYKFDHTQKNPYKYYSISRWDRRSNRWLSPVAHNRKLFWYHLPTLITLQKRHPNRYKSYKIYAWYTKTLNNRWNYGMRAKKNYRLKQILFGRIILPALDYLKKKQFLFIKQNVARVKPLGLQHSRPAMFLGKFERRLDILTYKLNFAPTIQWARSFVKSGLIYVNSLCARRSRNYKHILTKTQKFPLLDNLKTKTQVYAVDPFENTVSKNKFSTYGFYQWTMPCAITLPAYRVKVKSVVHWNSRNIRTLFFTKICKRYMPRYFIYNKNKTIAYFWRNLRLADIDRQRSATRIKWNTIKWLM